MNYNNLFSNESFNCLIPKDDKYHKMIIQRNRNWKKTTFYGFNNFNGKLISPNLCAKRIFKRNNVNFSWNDEIILKGSKKPFSNVWWIYHDKNSFGRMKIKKYKKTPSEIIVDILNIM